MNITQSAGEKFSQEGTIKKFFFVSSDEIYKVALFKIDKEEIRVTGEMIGIQENQFVHIEGIWENHKKYGLQIKASLVRPIIPKGNYDFKTFLYSGVIKGIKKVIADKIYDYFGSETKYIFENDIYRLLEVSGIGKKNIEDIINSYEKHKENEIYISALSPYGFNITQIYDLVSIYGENTINVVFENPYIIINSLKGFGFKKSDIIALKMGIEKDSPFRIQNAILYVLEEKSNSSGHVYLFYYMLKEEVGNLIDIYDEDKIKNEIKTLFSNEGVEVIEDDKGDSDYNKIFLKNLYDYEKYIANKIYRIMSNSKIDNNIEEVTNSFLRSIYTLNKEELSEQQLKAVEMSLLNNMIVLTGGPGTGKTFTINTIVKLFEYYGHSVKLAAPTGRASKRMSLLSQREAVTIHRLLGANLSLGFEYNEDNPIEADLIIIDESSMINIKLMYHLLKAVKSTTKLIFVGDADQLPAIGAGNVLRDIIHSKKVPVVKLDTIFRQGEGSSIVINAHKINNGEMPILDNNDENFVFIDVDSGSNRDKDINDRLFSFLDNEATKYPDSYEMFNNIQILSPQRKTDCGVSNYNEIIQNKYNRNALIYKSKFKNFKLNDKVMQIVNNYEKGVFNGDIGTIVEYIPKENIIVVQFEDKRAVYKEDDLELVLAYCITIHKSQGSEYHTVIIPLTETHYYMLRRNLLYTAITRSKSKVLLIGTKKALRIAINKNDVDDRLTYLQEHLNMFFGKNDYV